MSRTQKMHDTPALFLSRHPRRLDHPAIMNADGKLVATFGANETREEIAAAIEAVGYTLNNDNSISEATVTGLPQATARYGPPR